MPLSQKQRALRRLGNAMKIAWRAYRMAGQRGQQSKKRNLLEKALQISAAFNRRKSQNF